MTGKISFTFSFNNVHFSHTQSLKLLLNRNFIHLNNKRIIRAGAWIECPFLYIILIAERRYANLCALCEDPVKCDYPDRFSGYEGAIRCLVENGGDVAFTKVIYVRKFFGVSSSFVKTFDSIFQILK